MEELATGYTLIEGPVWDPERGLIFSDVHEGGAFCLSPTGDITTVIEHRRGMGGMALHADGGMVISGRNVAYKGPAAQGTVVLLDQESAGGVGFNDLTTDSAGRIYVGSLGVSPFDRESEQLSGCLHRIDLDGKATTLAEGIQLTNGLGFSPDGKQLYHSDSRAQIVGMYDVDDEGGVSERKGLCPGRAWGSRWPGCGGRWQRCGCDCRRLVRARLRARWPVTRADRCSSADGDQRLFRG